MTVEWYLLLLAFFLISMGTFLSPILAIGFSFLRRDRQTLVLAHSSRDTCSLDILIPAHHEILSLPASIRAMCKMRESAPPAIANIKILVGLSNWKGSEATMAAAGADKFLEISEAGKWNAIKALVKESKADWVALVDAGVVWNDNCLEVLGPLLLREEIVGINPRFQESKGGVLQKVIWNLESNLKLLENKSGGPISLHGATVFYRREKLQECLDRLKHTDWLNDDVVLPLALRTFFPQMRIVYTKQTAVTDLFPSWDKSELQRRKRLLLGNIQWVQTFYLQLLKSNPVIALLATRRVSRMIWAWWLVLLAGGSFMFALSNAGSLALAGALFVMLAFALLILRFASARRLLEAFWVSAAFPFYFFKFRFSGTVPRWK